MQKPTIEMLKKIPIFSRLTQNELSTLVNHMGFQNVKKDKVLFDEGDEGDYICFVVDGRLDVIKKTFDNEEIIINSLSKGQSFGEMSIIESSPRSATVKATTKTEMVCLNKKDFDSIHTNHPDIGMKILKGISLLLSRKLRQTSSRLISYMTKKS